MNIDMVRFGIRAASDTPIVRPMAVVLVLVNPGQGPALVPCIPLPTLKPISEAGAPQPQPWNTGLTGPEVVVTVYLHRVGPWRGVRHPEAGHELP